MNQGVEHAGAQGDTIVTRRMEWTVVAGAVCLAGLLGFANLAAPSLWHDELVHVYVGKSIAEGMAPQLPGGEPYYSGTVWNVILGGVIRLWGMNELTVRAPSVLIAMLNVVLAFTVVRALLGREAALVTALCMALSPWTIAWAREARFYSLQQCFYLVTVLGFWFACRKAESRTRNLVVLSCAVAAIAYVLGVLTSFHSILFLSGVGLFAGLMLITDSTERPKWLTVCAVIGALGIGTLASFRLMMNSLDEEAVFDRGGLGGEIVDAERGLRWYYLHWLWTNHSLGFFLLAMAGFGAMIYRRRPEGWLAALAFWGPVLMLTYFIGYRRFRFMFFAFPFYLAAVSYGLVVLVAWLRQLPARRIAWLPRVAVAVFLLRVGVSAATLAQDSFEVARGADTTLARRHPQWREPGAWVRENAGDAAILTTTYLPVLYYVGRVDDWYPNRFLWWEEDESGLPGMGERCELEAFMQEHPRGYYIVDRWRFDDGPWIHRFPEWAEEADWVKRTMRRIDEAGSEDVVVYAWDQH